MVVNHDDGTGKGRTTVGREVRQTTHRSEREEIKGEREDSYPKGKKEDGTDRGETQGRRNLPLDGEMSDKGLRQ